MHETLLLQAYSKQMMLTRMGFQINTLRYIPIFRYINTALGCIDTVSIVIY